MMEKKKILPIGSVVSVKYAIDKGKETVHVIVGHLSLRKASLCHYDYICVLFPFGVEKGLYYINYTDIVSVINVPSFTDEIYEKWLEIKADEYDTYYKHYRYYERPDIDAMRKRVVQGRNIFDRKTEMKKAVGIICLGGITLGAAAVAFLAGEWESGVCAFLFALMGYLTK